METVSQSKCPWCPEFVPVKGESHGMCASCKAELDKHITSVETTQKSGVR